MLLLAQIREVGTGVLCPSFGSKQVMEDLGKSSASSALLLRSGCHQGFCAPCFLGKKPKQLISWISRGKCHFLPFWHALKSLFDPVVFPLEQAGVKFFLLGSPRCRSRRCLSTAHPAGFLLLCQKQACLFMPHKPGVSQGFFCVRGGANSWLGCWCRGFKRFGFFQRSTGCC